MMQAELVELGIILFLIVFGVWAIIQRGKPEKSEAERKIMRRKAKEKLEERLKRFQEKSKKLGRVGAVLTWTVSVPILSFIFLGWVAGLIAFVVGMIIALWILSKE